MVTEGSYARSSSRTLLQRATGAFRSPATTFLLVAGSVCLPPPPFWCQRSQASTKAAISRVSTR